MTTEKEFPEDQLLDASEELISARKKLARTEEYYAPRTMRLDQQNINEAQEEVDLARLKFNAALRSLLQPLIREELNKHG